ncbi:MAG: hypothetical protein J0I47_09875 [Sphingomonas sp.]|uniref:hypothetical protein n=1 Tax=Sphingomonas sp. TaxID=28214 RepID=UPI001ACDAD49|nr:hypothetical protein [Sphingomonas sp.]MBN8808521.1 hypothetical protein [Sphingomonas sp.]
MSGQFVARCDSDRNLIQYTLDGFFGPDDLGTIQAERRAAHDQLHCGPNQHVTLCDVRGCKIQSQAVLAMFRTIVGEESGRARRLAFVTGESLARTQVRRIRDADPQRIGVFETSELAERWLLAEPDVPLAA